MSVTASTIDPAVAALTDAQVLTVTLYGEARGEPIEGQIAVGCVIRNRVDVGRWGASYAAVCLAPYQFSCWRPEGGRENYALVLQTARALAAATQLPEDRLLRQCAWIAQGILGHWILDVVRDATHYLTRQLYESKPPAWALGRAPVARVGAHVFFRGVS